MTIGGLTVGVTPLDMAHAYETIAHGGERVSGSLVSNLQPVGIQEVSAGDKLLSDGHHHDRNTVITKRVLPPEVASTETSVLETVLEYGTAKDAALGQFAAGKTGTTSNYGDAWFVGWDSKYTVAVWVGYPNSLVPMTTDYDGGPVLGGTFPALIWHNFMISAMQVEQERAQRAASSTHTKQGSTGTELESTSSGETTATPPPAGGRHARGRDRRNAGGDAQHARERHRRKRTSRRHATRRTGARGREPHSGDARTRNPRTGHAGTRKPFNRSPRQPQIRRRGHRRRQPGRLARPVATSSGYAFPSTDTSGHGRDTCGLSAAQKRQRSSTALLMPMRGPASTGGRPPSPALILTGPSSRLVPFSDSSTPNACVSLPGPEQRSRSRTSAAARTHLLDPARAARARGSAPPPPRPPARTPRSAARGCRRSDTRRQSRAHRTGFAVRGVTPTNA